MPTTLTLEQIEAFMSFVNNAFPKRPFSISPLEEFTAGRVLVATGNGLAVEPLDIGALSGTITIRPWMAETLYLAAYTDTGGNKVAGEIVSHEGSLYQVLTDFTTGQVFADVIGTEVVLSRLTMDSDLHYIELPFSGVGPFLADQTIGMYNPITSPLTVKERWNLPNTLAPHLQNQPYGKFYCNPNITTDTVVTLYRLFSTGEEILGTITFAPITAGPNYAEGTLNLGLAGEFILEVGDILVARITTVALELEWVCLNMLGSVRGVRSPEFNLPV